MLISISDPDVARRLQELAAELLDKKKANERARRLSERGTLLQQFKANQATIATELPRRRAELASRMEAARVAQAEAAETGYALHMFEGRTFREQTRLIDALTQRPSEAQAEA